MLIRVGGGTGGIKEYLEDGRKQGRGLTRDELDERVILSGNLEVVDAIIESMQGEGEKYTHITLSFREDEVSRELLLAIVQEFEQFVFAAYRPDEYAMYAEAHLPRLQSYNDAQTGALVERKPHIHIVIPELNLLSGGKLEPFGAVRQNVQYLDAFQEYINDKYGLASPKDHRRIEFTGESEMLSRYKGDLFDAQGKDLKTQILATVLDREINKYEDFVAMLSEFGDRRTRNAGRDDEYENVKTPGAAKGINLKDFVFRREFIELSSEAKRARLDEEAKQQYELPGSGRQTPDERREQLRVWETIRAREIKYLNSGNRRLWREYREADEPGRAAILAEREARFYEKHDRQQEPSNDARRDQSGPTRDFEPDRTWGLDNPFSGEAALSERFGQRPGRQPDLGSAPSLQEAESLHSLRDLSGSLVDGFGKDGPVLLPVDASRELEVGEPVAADPLRRGGAEPGAGERERVEDMHGRQARVVDAAGQLLQDLGQESREQAKEGPDSEAQAWRELKRQIDARALLKHLSKSHGALLEKYEVTQGADGADRIKCGPRNLNVSDFLTKVLHLPWDQAEQILREAYARQQQPGAEPARAVPNAQLWRQFAAQRRQAQQTDRFSVRQQQKLAYQHERAGIRQAYYAERRRVASMPRQQRRAELSIARMRRVVAETELRKRIVEGRAARRADAGLTDIERYRLYLQALAQGGDEAVLRELRRMAPPGLSADSAGDSISGGTAGDRAQRDRLLHAAGLSYRIEINGDVTYKRGDAEILRDRAKTINVLAEDARSLETALRLAQQKFGTTLTLKGSRGFQDKVARAAAELGLGVRFSDQRLNQVMLARRQELTPNRSGPERSEGPDRS